MSPNDFCDPDSGFDYIFARMNAIYGATFQRQWVDADPTAVRQTWKEIVGNFLTYRPSMDYALHKLPPDYPPSALAFRDLCRNGPEIPKEQKAISYNKNPLAKQQALQKLAGLRFRFDHLEQ